MFNIENNVPMPVTLNHSKYPWNKMSVGDCFLVPGKTTSLMSGQATVAGQRRGQKFKAVNVEGGVRVWRTE